MNDNERSGRSCVQMRRRGGGAPAESHPLSSLHPPTDPSIPSPPLPRWWWRLEGQPPCSDTLTHIRRHTPPRCVTTNLPLPIISACSCIYLHLLFSRPLLSLSPSLHPCLSFTSPPRRVSQLLGEERKMLRPTNVEEKTVKRVKGSGSWSVFAAHRCLHPP